MADRYILAVESSCDETSVAVLKNEKELLSNIIASQVESHKRFGGVVPEVASRHHVEVVTLCIKDALSEAGIVAEQLDAVAVTYGPGLVGALLVGMAAAKAFAWAHGLPLIPVNHMAGHLMAAREVQAEQKGAVLVTEDLCASFQAAVLDILLAKTKKALERYPVKTLVVAGGVAANQGLRERLAEEITDVDVVIPPLRLCGDNAGMIALAAAIECDKKHFADLDLNAKPSLAFAGFEE